MAFILVFITIWYNNDILILLCKVIFKINKNFKDTVMQANPGTIVGLLSLSTNSSASSLFHAKKACAIKGEKNSLTLVIQKLDREQAHPDGTARFPAFREYLAELDKKYEYAEYWANHHYYRDVIMKDLQAINNYYSDNISDISSVTSSASSIVSWLS